MRISQTAIEPDELRASLTDNAAGGYVAFEGWIRNENEGQEVLRLVRYWMRIVCTARGSSSSASARFGSA
jgi:molybdopterin synthase catalytic subunit